MNEQKYTDFFDPEIQKNVSEDGCSVYKMKNMTGEALLPATKFFRALNYFIMTFI